MLKHVRFMRNTISKPKCTMVKTDFHTFGSGRQQTPRQMTFFYLSYFGSVYHKHNR